MMPSDPWKDSDPGRGDFDAELAGIDRRYVETHGGDPNAGLRIVGSVEDDDAPYGGAISGDPSSDTRAFFETVREIDRHRPAFDRAQVLTASADALKSQGHLRLVQATAKNASFDYLSGPLALVIFVGLGGSAGVVFRASLFGSIMLTAGIAIAYIVLAVAVPRLAGPGAGLLIFAWLGTAIVTGVSAPAVLLFTHGLPIVGAVGLAVVRGTLRLREARDVALAFAGVARSAPYLVPVVLVAVLLPALTDDVWKLAASANTKNFIGALALSVGVLLLLVRRQLRAEFEPALTARCIELARRPSTPERSRGSISNAVDQELGAAVAEVPSETLVRAWPASSDEYVPYLAATEGDGLRRPLTGRLFVTVALIALLLTAYVYALLGFTVPTRVATEWAGIYSKPFEMSPLGIDVSLPGVAPARDLRNGYLPFVRPYRGADSGSPDRGVASRADRSLLAARDSLRVFTRVGSREWAPCSVPREPGARESRGTCRI